MGFHSLTTTTHPPNVSVQSSGQQSTARLSARRVSVARGNMAQDLLVRDTTDGLTKKSKHVASIVKKLHGAESLLRS